MRNLEVWGVPSYIVDIWEKSYSPYLLPVQEEAARDYGVLDYEESKGLPRRCAPRNDRGMDSRFRGNDIKGNRNVNVKEIHNTITNLNQQDLDTGKE